MNMGWRSQLNTVKDFVHVYDTHNINATYCFSFFILYEDFVWTTNILSNALFNGCVVFLSMDVL